MVSLYGLEALGFAQAGKPETFEDTLFVMDECQGVFSRGRVTNLWSLKKGTPKKGSLILEHRMNPLCPEARKDFTAN